MRVEDRNRFVDFELMNAPSVLMEDTLNMVEDFQTAPPEKRQQILQEITQQIIEEPLRLRPLLHNLGVVNIARDDLNPDETREAIIGHTEQTLSEGLDLSLWTPGKIANLVRTRIAGSEIHGQDIERIEAALFTSPKSINQSIDLLYNAAWAMAQTSNHEVQRELFSVLNLQKDWFSATSPSAMHFIAGLYASDNLHLARFHSVLTTLDYIGIFADRSQASILRFIILEGFLPDSRKRLLIELVNNQKALLGSNFETLFNLYMKEGYLEMEGSTRSEDTFLEAAQRRERYELTHDMAEWPNYVIRSPNEPLRRLVLDKYGDQAFRAKWENRVIELQKEEYEIQTQNPIQLTEDLSLVVLAKRIHSLEQRNWVISEVKETLASGRSDNPMRRLYVPMDRVLSEARLRRGLFEYFDAEKNIVFSVFPSHSEQELGRLPSIIEYHRWPISTEQFEKISKKTQEVRRHIQTLFTRSLGTRGYRVSFDPKLRDMGYQNIIFRYDREGGETRVTLTLAKQIYQLSLDRGYRIIPGGDVRRFASLQDQIWLELLILTHLKKVLCTEDDKLEDELTESEKQKDVLHKQRFYRGEGLRWMKNPLKNPDGTLRRNDQGRLRFAHWSKKADRWFRNASFPDMTEEERQYGLIVTNQLRAKEGKGGTDQTGWWTYVRPSERGGEEVTEPIKITFKDNADLYSVVPPTRTISPEELQRLYDEALREVGVPV